MPWPAGNARGQNGLKIPSQVSIPRPDLAIVRGTPRDYLKSDPKAAEAALVAEVSISSLDEDRAMAEIYAVGGIPVYWIVDVDDGQVEVFSDPGPSGYRSHEILAPGHVLSVIIDGGRNRRVPGWPTSCPDGVDHAQADYQATPGRGDPGGSRGPVPGRRYGHAVDDRRGVRGE